MNTKYFLLLFTGFTVIGLNAMEEPLGKTVAANQWNIFVKDIEILFQKRNVVTLDEIIEHLQETVENTAPSQESLQMSGLLDQSMASSINNPNLSASTVTDKRGQLLSVDDIKSGRYKSNMLSKLRQKSIASYGEVIRTLRKLQNEEGKIERGIFEGVVKEFNENLPPHLK